MSLMRLTSVVRIFRTGYHAKKPRFPMHKATISAGRAAAALIVLTLTAYPARGQNAAVSPSSILSTVVPSQGNPSFLYGRVVTDGGETYEGRLRWGPDEEAFWGNYFNGTKSINPWVDYLSPEQLSLKRPPIEIFGLKISRGERQMEVGRPFMARFGDIARIEASGDGLLFPDVRVTLKSGTVHDLDRLSAGDFDDGVRVWDRTRGVVDLESGQIRTIEFFSTARLDDVPARLQGTVRTPEGEFAGFLQWNRKDAVGRDQLVGQSADGRVALRFDTIQSIARHSPTSSLVTLIDGSEMVLSGTRKVGQGNLGVYVDDLRYGRVLVSWEAFERVDLGGSGGGPSYHDFPPGRPLTGSVSTRSGRRLAGRVVFDLDESESTETLDAPSHGVNYTLPFGLIASVSPLGGNLHGVPHASVVLHSGEELLLERAGDLGDANAGLLIFVKGRESPVYVPWADVTRLDLNRPPAMYPPVGRR
jgi:hypothetical protein